MSEVDMKKPDAGNTEKIIEKYDKESRFRKFPKLSKMGKIITAICVIWALFHLYTGAFGELDAIKQRALTLGFAMVLTFILYPGRKGSPRSKPSIFDWLFAVLSVIACGYIIVQIDGIIMRGGMLTQKDYVMGVVAIVLIFEASRRVMGYILPVLAAVFLLYTYFGRLMPGLLQHGGFSINRIIEHMYISTDGIFGVALGVAASYIILFVTFGAFLGETGLGALINDVAMAIAGRSPGGPAKVAVVGSGLMGMINGSPIANCATMGAFTIPLMKKVGYKPYFAGAVESVAATGGCVMPPVMGAAAFLIAEFLSIPYKTIMLAGIIPALLYYYCVMCQVHFEALKSGIKGMSKDQLPNLKKALAARGHLILPLIIIVALLLYGVTPTFAAVYSTLATILASFLRKETRLTFAGFIRALETAARSSLSVVMAVAIVGFIIGSCGLTGIGMRLADSIVSISGGNLFLTLLFTMVACIILGMGLPTTACYIVAATIAAPALLKLGVDMLPAHFFVFYLANMSNITPPVCLAAFTGAAIAGADPNKVGFTAFRLGIAGFLVAFTFVYSPEFLLYGDVNALGIIVAVITALIGITAIAAGLEGYFIYHATAIERILFVAGGMLMFYPGIQSDFIGIVIIAITFFIQRTRKKKLQPCEA